MFVAFVCFVLLPGATKHFISTSSMKYSPVIPAAFSNCVLTCLLPEPPDCKTITSGPVSLYVESGSLNDSRLIAPKVKILL